MRAYTILFWYSAYLIISVFVSGTEEVYNIIVFYIKL